MPVVTKAEREKMLVEACRKVYLKLAELPPMHAEVWGTVIKFYNALRRYEDRLPWNHKPWHQGAK